MYSPGPESRRMPLLLFAIVGCAVFTSTPTLLSQSRAAPTQLAAVIPADDPRIAFLGRYDSSNLRAPRFGYPGAGFMLRFQGSALTLDLDSDSVASALTLVLDHAEPTLVMLDKGSNHVLIPVPATTWDNTAIPHTLEIYKRTETWQSILTFRGIEPGAAVLLPVPALPARKLLFVGDSVTCGAGVNNAPSCKNQLGDPASDAYHSYGMLLSRHLDSQVELVCYGGRGLQRDYVGRGNADGVLNAPGFLDLAIPTDDPAKRAAWNPAQFTPDGIVVSIGTNDFNLQSTQPLDPETFVAAYSALLQRLRTEYPQATILATEGAIVTNPLLPKLIKAAVASLRDPYILWIAARHYPGNGCDGHPTREQHMHIADDLEPVLRDHLHW